MSGPISDVDAETLPAPTSSDLARAAAVAAAVTSAACGSSAAPSSSTSSTSTSSTTTTTTGSGGSTGTTRAGTGLIAHLLRRAAFSGSADDIANFSAFGYTGAVDALLNYSDTDADNIDSFIRTPGYIGVIATREFTPDIVIGDARQRWLFRMVHSPAPLREKMALFWHNHFATGYSKIAGVVGTNDGARLMDARATTDAGGQQGQVELFRKMAVGKFSDLLLEISKHPSMSIWLDGRLNTRTNPQENFGREIIELFTMGVANYVEADVYAAARVFTGWNLQSVGDRTTTNYNYQFIYNSAQHETTAKTFSFAVYPDGGNTIPARAAASGMQDGLDLIAGLARHPETAKRLARKFWNFFVSETKAPDEAWVSQIASVYLANDTAIKPTLRAVFLSSQFMDTANFYQRYSWPAELLVRAIKEVGFLGFNVNDVLTPMVNMGQTLYEPPDVSGWDLGTWWFSTNAMLSRMNVASQLATNQKFNLRDLAKASGYTTTVDAFITNWALNRLTIQTPDSSVYSILSDYVKAGGTWTGSDTQITNKAGGLIHLLVGSPDYQFV